MKYCTVCKTEYPDGVSTCPLDGTQLKASASNAGVQCPKCGALGAPGTVYCTECGAKIEQSPSKVQCSQCGEVVSANSNYCPKCGYHLSDQKHPPLPPEPVVLVRFPFMPPNSTAITNAFDPRSEPDARHRVHEFNTMRLKLIRAHDLQAPVSSEVLQATVGAVDSYLSALESDSNAQDFLPHATQAAAFWLYIILSGWPPDAFETDKIDDCLLPQKYKDLLRIPGAALILAESYVFLATLPFWPAEAFFAVEKVCGKDSVEFANVVCHSLRELCYLTFPTVALRKGFLSEEDWKLNNGYYPDSIKQQVSQVLSSLHAMNQKLEQHLSSSPGAEENSLFMQISPLSMALAGVLGLKLRTFTAGEQKAFDVFRSLGLDGAAMLVAGSELQSFFEELLQEQDTNAKNISVEQNPAAHALFEIAYFFLWRYCNIIGWRRSQTPGIPLRPPLMPGVSWEALIARIAAVYDTDGKILWTDQEYARALLGQSKTIEMLWVEIKAANAAQKAKQNPGVPKSGSASADSVQGTLYLTPTAEGGRHTPVFSGYSPDITKEGTHEKLHVKFEGYDIINPGQSCVVHVELLDHASGVLHGGDRFTVWEGDFGHVVGALEIA